MDASMDSNKGELAKYPIQCKVVLNSYQRNI